MKIGVIADTHGLIPRGLDRSWKGLDLIIHAGDIGGRPVLDFLRTIAPVRAVRGNYDHLPELAGLLLPDPSPLELDGIPALVTHRLIGMAWGEHRRLYAHALSAFDPRPRLVIFGHTHHPVCEEVEGVWFFNPGYAGPDPLEGGRTAGLVRVEGGRIQGEIFPI